MRTLLSSDETTKGRELRQRTPRRSHAEWDPAKKARDPIGILQAADADRLPNLVPIRYGRMLQSPFAFYRGSAAVMAADLVNTPASGIVVQACGDCHLKNFGGFATPERNIVFDINDFDETLPAPWEWDLKRLATSFVLAARTIGADDDDARATAVVCTQNYRKGIQYFSTLSPLALWYARIDSNEFLDLIPNQKVRTIVEQRIAKAATKSGAEIDYSKLAEAVNGSVRIRDNPPLIFHDERTHDDDFRPLLDEVLKNYRATLLDERRALLDRYQLVDAALKVVGVGSVGTRCWIALLMSPSNDPLFLQFKQANASVLEPYAGQSAYPHHGQRVVNGQRLMQAASDIFLGWTSGPSGDFYVRQLRDAKIGPNVEAWDVETLSFFASVCGRNLARAHAKGGNALTVGGYLGKSDAFDEAIGQFAMAYADQAEADHAALKAAVRSGTIDVITE